MITELDELGVNLPDLNLELFNDDFKVENDTDEETEENDLKEDVTEEEESTDTNEVSGDFDDQLISVTSEWIEKGLIPYDEDTIPDEFKEEGFDINKFLKLVEMSLEKTKEDTRNEVQKVTFEKVVGSMPEILQRTFEYSLNGVEETDVKDYMKSLLYEQDIKDLDPTNTDDAEKIVTEWYKDQGIDAATRDKRVNKLKERGELEEEAAMFKPKLDAKAEEIAQSKVQFQNNIKNQEQVRKKDLSERIIDVFEKNNKNDIINIKGIPVDKELAGFLHHALVNNEVPVNIGGKTVDLTIAEALILHHKYDKNGSLEDLMRALVLLRHPDKFDAAYAQRNKKEDTEAFIKDHRFSAQRKSGNIFNKKDKSDSDAPKMKLF